MLLEAGAGTPDDINRAKQDNCRLGLFLRSLVGLDREAAKRSFDAFLVGKKPTANQIEFIDLESGLHDKGSFNRAAHFPQSDIRSAAKLLIQPPLERPCSLNL